MKTCFEFAINLRLNTNRGKRRRRINPGTQGTSFRSGRHGRSELRSIPNRFASCSSAAPGGYGGRCLLALKPDGSGLASQARAASRRCGRSSHRILRLLPQTLAASQSRGRGWLNVAILGLRNERLRLVDLGLDGGTCVIKKSRLSVVYTNTDRLAALLIETKRIFQSGELLRKRRGGKVSQCDIG